MAGSAPDDQIPQRVIPSVHQVSLSDGGVPKSAALFAQVTRDGLGGDRQRNRKYHGGPDRAVCLFSLEVIEALRTEGHSIGPGSSGENLTLAGLDWVLMRPGDRLRIGEQVQLELTSYTTPCRHNAQWFKGGNYERIDEESHPGWSRLYAQVLHAGTVRPGDRVVVEQRMKQVG